MSAVEVQSFRRICGVSLDDQISNEEIHRIVGTSEDVTHGKNEEERALWKWVMEEWQKDEKNSSKRGRGRPRLTFENSITNTGGIYEEVDDSERGKRDM